jgi:general secretion pathway protein A
MEYYKLLQLEREPFSNSPDPAYFFQSRQHLICLHKIEMAIHLKRGLNVVIGDIGTGKTTLCRELIRRLAQQDAVDTHLILDPSFTSSIELLITIYLMLHEEKPDGSLSTIELKEAIKQELYTRGVDHQRTMVIIIDEGQKISSPCIEILRELLNYETNEFKLLQIIIFAQPEFEGLLEAHPNFHDRINVLHHLAAMNFADTRRMIRHRLKIASDSIKAPNIFTLPAQWAIYRFTRGYPRRIVHLCHQAILSLIIQNRSQAGWQLIQSCKRRMPRLKKSSRRPFGLKYSVPILIIVAAIIVLLTPFYRYIQQNDPMTNERFRIESKKEAILPSDSEATLTSTESVVEASIDGVVIHNDEALRTIPNEAVASQALAEEINDDGASPVPPNADAYAVLPALDTPQTALAVEPRHETEQPPLQLGHIKVQDGDTMSEIVLSVYGEYRPAHLDAIMEANPRLRSSNSIKTGDTIRIPALHFQAPQDSAGHYWITLEQSDELADALELADHIADKINDRTRTMALWSASKGVYFDVLLYGYYESLENAQNHILTLPADFAQKASITSGWDEDIHLLSFPFSGGIRRKK